MLSLAHFSGSEAELLIALPYRAGVLVSYADDVDGEHDDAREGAALSAALKGVAALYEGSPLVASIFKETLRLKSEWPRWREGIFKATADAQAAASLLRSKGDEKLVRSYRAAVLQVASAVARAHAEFEETEQDAGLLGGLIDKIVSGFSGDDDEEGDLPMNVSASEGGVLDELATALKGGI